MFGSFEEFNQNYISCRRNELMLECEALAKRKRVNLYTKLADATAMDVAEIVFVDPNDCGRAIEVKIYLDECGPIDILIHHLERYLTKKHCGHIDIPTKTKPQETTVNLPFDLSKFIDEQISKRDRHVSIFKTDLGITVQVYPYTEDVE